MINKFTSLIISSILIIIFFYTDTESEAKFKVQNPIHNQIYYTSVDSLIPQLLDEINPDSVEYFMQSLQNFGTRWALHPNRFEIANWIKDEFFRFGFSDVVLDSFELYIPFPLDTLTWQVNVIATIAGTEREDDIYIFGGHYDSWVLIGDPMIFAPGADDNASGCSALMEVARVMQKVNFQPEATLKFIAFAAEEIGGLDRGSGNYAQKAYDSGINIEYMLNNDVISYTTQSVDNRSINIWGVEELVEFKQFAYSNMSNYSSLIPVVNPNEFGSDASSFARLGYTALSFSEGEHNPDMHSEEDILSNCNIEYCTEIIKASSVNLILVMGMPSKVDKFNVVDMGDGNSLLLNWSPAADEDLAGYLVSIGTDSGAYDTTYSTSDTTMIIDDLSEGVEYFVSITTYDLEGYESFPIEKRGTPNSLPLPPSNIIESPQWHQVILDWSPNLEFDLLGYNIYRSLNEEEPGDKLNTEIISDTVFIDETAENGVYYYYTVKSIDNQFNESINNVPVKSRSVSLDQGIVLVDESSDGNGTILNPTDEQVDEFYTQLLERFERENFDIIEEEGISLKDLGAFSTVIWHGSDFRDVATAFEIVDDIQKYLDYGGNLIYTGFLPSEAFENNTLYPTNFETGDFIYDYLKIERVENIFGSRFAGALPLSSGYSSLYTDSSKTSPNANYHLPYIEGISANQEGTEIYLYETYYDTSSSQGSMKEEPVGVEYIGEDYKAVTLSFPLYYMTFDESKALIEYILINKFSEVVSIETPDDQNLPDKFVLEQNYPNPFNPTTAIGYRLPAVSDVELSIYNTLGQKVATLVSARQPAGTYTVEWDASGFASGVYYYRLSTAKGLIQTKKLVLIK